MRLTTTRLFPLALMLVLALLTFYLERIVHEDETTPNKRRHDPDYIVTNFTATTFDAELAAARGHRARAPAREHGAGDAGRGEHLHAVAVEGMERLQLLAGGPVPEPAVGEHAVDVEDHEPDAPRPFQRVGGGELHAVR